MLRQGKEQLITTAEVTLVLQHMHKSLRAAFVFANDALDSSMYDVLVVSNSGHMHPIVEESEHQIRLY